MISKSIQNYLAAPHGDVIARENLRMSLNRSKEAVYDMMRGVNTFAYTDERQAQLSKLVSSAEALSEAAQQGDANQDDLAQLRLDAKAAMEAFESTPWEESEGYNSTINEQRKDTSGKNRPIPGGSRKRCKTGTRKDDSGQCKPHHGGN